MAMLSLLHRSVLVVVAATAVLALAEQALAADNMDAAPRPHMKRALLVLTKDALDPQRLLPPPPLDGSDLGKRDLEETERAYRNRTAEEFARAGWDDKHEDSSLFAATLGPNFNLAHLPKTAALLKIVENEQAIAANMAKVHFLLLRPWSLDPSIKPCDYNPNANPKTSYPSGHATLGYSVGYVLAALIPQKAEAIETRAAEYAHSREICGDHFPSDLEASHVLGVAVALQLLQSPKLTDKIAEARAELDAAHLSQ